MENDWYQLLEQFDEISHLSDDEIKAYLATLSKGQKAMLKQIIATKRAMHCADTPSPDTEKAWEKFSEKHIQPARKISPLIRKFSVAASITVLIAGIAIAANTLGWFEWRENSSSETQVIKPTDTESIASPDKAHPDSVVVTENSSIEIYDNVTLEAILSNMAQYYHATLRFNSRNSAHLRVHFEWDKSLPLERNIRLLNNFENANLSLKDNVIIVEE